MYGNVCYDYKKSTMWMSTWDNDGNRITTEEEFFSYLYVCEKDAVDAVSIYGEPLKKMTFKNPSKRKEYAEFNKRTYYNLPIDQQYLLGKFAGHEQDETFDQFPLRIFYLDIEVFAPNGFPHPEEANDEITLITVYESTTKIYHTFGQGAEYWPKDDNVMYHYFKDEKSMIRGFIKWWRKDFPDVISGWYSLGFDIPYLCNRINRIYDDPEACYRLSPVGLARKQENVDRRFGATQRTYDLVWNIMGVSHIDLQAAYFKFSKDKLESYSLDSVCEHELGSEYQKFSHGDTSLSDWWLSNPTEFIDYNIQDVKLLLKLDEKLKYVQLCRQLAYRGLCRMEGALGTLGVITGLVAAQALLDGKIISTFDNSDIEAEFTGGYVSDPVPGFHRSIVSVDANSMYPNAIVTLNISPETKIGKWEDLPDGSVRVELVSGAKHVITKEKFEEFVAKLEIALAPNNVMFSQRVKGVLPKMIDGLYMGRVHMKDRMKKINKECQHLKKTGGDPAKIAELEKTVEFLDMRQYTTKILMNSAYGAVSERHFALFDLDMSSAVTALGRECIQHAATYINDCASQILGREIDVGTYSDTDSRYFTIQPILDAENTTFMIDDKINPRVYEIAQIFEDHVNHHIKEWATSTHRSKRCTMQFKREALAPVAVWQCSKHYVVYCRDDEGVECDEFHYTGIAVVRSSTPKKLRPMIKDIIETLIRTQSRVAVSDLVLKYWNEYQKLDLYDKVVSVTANNLNEYTKKSRDAGVEIALHTPRHVACAIRYNQMLRDQNLAMKYEIIKEGDKMKTMYIVPNKRLKVNSVGFKSVLPDEWKQDYIFDDSTMFDKTIVSCIEPIVVAVGWTVPNPTRCEKLDLVEMFSD